MDYYGCKGVEAWRGCVDYEGCCSAGEIPEPDYPDVICPAVICSAIT
jgi:hypothetical protein